MKKYLIHGVLILLFGIALFLNSCVSKQAKDTTETSLPQSIDTLKQIKVIDDIPYREGDSRSWRLDLAMPDNFGDKPYPAIVLVHGGGWAFGSKQENVFRSYLLDYAKQGYVTISVEYRFDGEAPFPACIEDVKCAIRWLRAHATEYNVDPDRIGGYGHSAGAHLVLMAAMSSENPDLEGDGGWREYSSKLNSVVGGSSPTEISPQLIKWDKPEWWPIGYISGEAPPILIIQGVVDPIVKVNLVDDFVEKMKAAGADITYLRVDSVAHDVSYTLRLDVTKPAMDEFFDRTLKKD